MITNSNKSVGEKEMLDLVQAVLTAQSSEHQPVSTPYRQYASFRLLHVLCISQISVQREPGRTHHQLDKGENVLSHIH